MILLCNLLSLLWCRLILLENRLMMRYDLKMIGSLWMSNWESLNLMRLSVARKHIPVQLFLKV